MTDLCSVPGCLQYVCVWRLTRKRSLNYADIEMQGEDRFYVGFCAKHARLGPYEQRRLL